jgi:hypothetical protein
MGMFLLLLAIGIWIGIHVIACAMMGTKVALTVAGLFHFIALLPLFLMREGFALTVILDVIFTFALFATAIGWDDQGKGPGNNDRGSGGGGSGGGGKFLRNVGIATVGGYFIGKKFYKS